MNVQNVLPRDAIPSIDEPGFGADHFGGDGDDVIVVESDPPRAYPIRILSYHEIVNDAVEWPRPSDGGASGSTERRPIAVTWCPICASAVVYDRRVDGRTLTFGTSGKLADDALVMYDRETGSEWKQPLGAAISGPLDGRELEVVPSLTTTWGRFRSEFPDGEVLQPVHGGADDPRGRSPSAAYDTTRYDRYDRDEAFGLRAMRGEGPEREWNRDDVDAKTTVLGVVHGGAAVGYPLPSVRAAGGVLTDTVGGLDVLVVRDGDDLNAFADPGQDFELRDGRLHGDGATWDPVTGRSDDGRRLRPIRARRLYAFAWQDDHGPDSFYGLG